MKPSQKVEVYDVCNTLYDSNTTFDFLKFIIIRKGSWIKKILYWNLTVKYSPLFIFNALQYRLMKKDVARKQALRLLKGFNVEEVDQLARLFYDEYLIYRKIDETFSLLDKPAPDLKIVLISNSIEPVIAVIAGKLGVDFYATRLEIDKQGRFTGEVIEDLHSRKKEIFLRYFAEGASLERMITDNKSDKDLLSMAKNKLVVLYKSADKNFWKDLNPGYIEKF